MFSAKISDEMMKEAKQFGMSDKQIGRLLNSSENDARIARINKGIKPWVKQVIRFNRSQSVLKLKLLC